MSACENGMSPTNNDHDKDNCSHETQQEDVTHGAGEDEGDIVQSNGEIFSPDLSENVVTVISADAKAEDTKKKEKGEQEACDDYDTHSDSIETLEEDSPDESQEKLCDSVLQQIRLTNSKVGETEGDVQQGQSALQTGGDRLGDDNTSTDSHEVIAETVPPTSGAAARPESLSLPRSLQYLERNRSASDTHSTSSSGSKPLAKGEGHQRTRSEAIDIHAVRVKGDLGFGDDVMSKSLPHGTIMRKGDLIEFIADDLQEKIKRSSPMSRTGTIRIIRFGICINVTLE